MKKLLIIALGFALTTPAMADDIWSGYETCFQYYQKRPEAVRDNPAAAVFCSAPVVYTREDIKLTEKRKKILIDFYSKSPAERGDMVAPERNPNSPYKFFDTPEAGKKFIEDIFFRDKATRDKAWQN